MAFKKMNTPTQSKFLKASEMRQGEFHQGVLLRVVEGEYEGRATKSYLLYMPDIKQVKEFTGTHNVNEQMEFLMGQEAIDAGNAIYEGDLVRFTYTHSVTTKAGREVMKFDIEVDDDVSSELTAEAEAALLQYDKDAAEAAANASS